MDIKLARIDDRLIHGQVVTVWAKEANADRIIVVSEEVDKDPVRKTLVRQAAPPGIKVNVVDVEKAVKVYNNPKYKDVKVFYLFTNPIEVKELVDKGVSLKSINIGGVQYQDGRKQVTKAVFLTEKEAQALTYLDEQGIELDGRIVASDPKIDFKRRLSDVGF